MTTKLKPTNNKLRPLLLALQAAVATGIALPTTPTWGAQTTLIALGNISDISADGRFVSYDSDGEIFVRDRLTNVNSLASVVSTGVQGITFSSKPVISADGRFVAFQSPASNLVAGDSNAAFDVFVRDLLTNQTTRVSVGGAGLQGNNHSFDPAISADGRYVSFTSRASNLVVGDTNGFQDVFVRDRLTKTTTIVSVDSAGIQANNDSYDKPAISATGRYVAFTSVASNLVANDTNGAGDVFVHDRTTKQTTRVSVDSTGVQGNYSQNSRRPSISADGRFVAFESNASLVLDDTNPWNDIFVRDRSTNLTTRVSVDSAGIEGNYSSGFASMSADGRFVAFDSTASNLAANDNNARSDIFVRDRTTNKTTRISVSNNLPSQVFFGSTFPSINSDGRFVAFSSDDNNTNGSSGIFVRDQLLTPAITSDLALTQTVSANPVTVGASFSYTATITNQGPGNAANVVLTDFASLGGKVSLPTFLPSQGKCTRSPISICRLGTVNTGQQATVQMTFTAIRQGVIANRVTVSASPKDPTPFNSVTTSTTIVP